MILYEDNDLLAVNKSAGEVVIPAREGDPEQCLRKRLERERNEALWVVHRIDRDTSGVVLFARNADAHRALCAAFEGRHVHKHYVCLTRGVPVPREWTIDVPLHVARKGKMRPATPHEKEGLPARTEYVVREVWKTLLGDVALVEVRPRTGRQHQIRVHMRSRETPLLVDPLYGRCEKIAEGELGATIPAIARLTLHALALEFPWNSKPFRVDAPIADDLASVIAAMRMCTGKMT
jgi:RluA family pseudouridine synthase